MWGLGFWVGGMASGPLLAPQYLPALLAGCSRGSCLLRGLRRLSRQQPVRRAACVHSAEVRVGWAAGTL